MSRTRETGRQIEELVAAEKRLEAKRAELERVGHRPAAAKVAEREVAELEAAVAKMRADLGDHAPRVKPAPAEAPQAVAPAGAGITLKLTALGEAIPEGSSVRLEATFTNRTAGRVVVWGEDDHTKWTYHFGDSWVAEFSGLPPCAPPMPRVIEPGAMRTVRAALDQHVHFRHAGGTQRRHLPPGTYALTVRVAFTPQNSNDPLAYTGEAISDPVTLHVTPRASVSFERPGVSLGPGAPGAYHNDRDHLKMLAAMASSEPRVLPVIVHQVRRMVAYGSLLGMPPRELVELAWLGADAGAACYGVVAADGRRDARLGGGQVSFTVPSWPTGGRDLLWLHAFELAAISRNADALRTLLEVPSAELSVSGGPTSARMRHIDALRAVVRHEEADAPIRALANVPAGEDAPMQKARAAALEALFREDLPGLDAALLDLLGAFRAAHFRADSTPSPDALLCFEALALASQADARGLPLGVISEFMPTRLLLRPE